MSVGIYCEVESRGSLACLKARLVAKGYSQVYGMVYQDTFSPIAKKTSVQILVSLVVTLHQLDVKNVLDEEVYTEQPSGFVAQEPRKVYRLKKSLNELKQSPKVWFR